MSQTDITIGMNRERAQKLADELHAAVEKGGNIDVTVYGRLNGGGRDEVIINIDNSDMERDDVKPDEVFVDVDRS